MSDPRDEVALACRVLASQGQTDMIWGHVAVRDPDGRGAWLKGAGLGFAEITADDVVLVGWDGVALEGDARVHLEYPIHTELLRARPDLTVTVHSHAESVVLFAATGMTLRPLGHEGSLFTPPDLPVYTETGDLIRTAEMGASVARAIGERNAVVLRHHGFVAAGVDVATAIVTSVLLEKACRMQVAAAAAVGREGVTWSDDEEALGKRSRVYSDSQIQNAWKYLVRGLDG